MAELNHVIFSQAGGRFRHGGEELRQFTDLLRRAATEFGATVVATASPTLACKPSDRVLEIEGGIIRRDSELLPEPGA